MKLYIQEGGNMKKEWRIKTLAISIIVLFIGVGFQHAFAVETKSSDLNEKPSINDGLPDLIIEDINFQEHDPGSGYYYIYCYVKNQGDDYAYGNLTVDFNIKKTFFWWLNMRTIYEVIRSKNLKDGLAPGEKIYVSLYAGEDILPFFCFAKFFVKINTDKKIIESNYDNNKDMLKVFASIFGWSYSFLWW